MAAINIAGLTTYLLQAREVAYTNSQAVQTYARLRGTPAASDLAGTSAMLARLQTISLETAFEQSQHNVSGGRIGSFRWRRVDVDFSDRWNRPKSGWSAREAQRFRSEAQSQLAALSASEEADSGWCTVIAQVMSPGWASRRLLGFTRMGSSPPGDVEALEKSLGGKNGPSLTREPEHPRRPRR